MQRVVMGKQGDAMPAVLLEEGPLSTILHERA
jgi:hypothetical protein